MTSGHWTTDEPEPIEIEGAPAVPRSEWTYPETTDYLKANRGRMPFRGKCPQCGFEDAEWVSRVDLGTRSGHCEGCASPGARALRAANDRIIAENDARRAEQ